MTDDWNDILPAYLGTEINEPIFVFGSNLAGRHGKGAALFARKHKGAIYGQGEGRQGGSYALPTKDEQINTLPLSAIFQHVQTFLAYAVEHPELEFELTPIGCGLAGYRPEDIAPLFSDAPKNVLIPTEFLKVLGRTPDGKIDGEVEK